MATIEDIPIKIRINRVQDLIVHQQVMTRSLLHLLLLIGKVRLQGAEAIKIQAWDLAEDYSTATRIRAREPLIATRAVVGCLIHLRNPIKNQKPEWAAAESRGVDNDSIISLAAQHIVQSKKNRKRYDGFITIRAITLELFFLVYDLRT